MTRYKLDYTGTCISNMEKLQKICEKAELKVLA
jgi:hypothetical protein